LILVGTDRLEAVIKRDEQVYNRFYACHRFEIITRVFA
jgi:DNA transposition AAA+ family ATPase